MARVDTSLVGEVLSTVEDAEAALFVMRVVLGRPLPQVAQLLSLPEEEVRRQLSTETRSRRMWDELFDSQTPASAELRALTTELFGTLFRRCVQCDRTFLPPNLAAQGGRPRRFCSNACRQAAYRKRRSEPVPDQRPALPRRSRLPDMPKPPRPAICSTGFWRPGDLQADCVLRSWHDGPHHALCAQNGEPMWAIWTQESGPLRRHPVCTAAAQPRPGAPWCALPLGHGGCHLFIKAPRRFSWEEGTAIGLRLSRNLATALRMRLSPPPHAS